MNIDDQHVEVLLQERELRVTYSKLRDAIGVVFREYGTHESLTNAEIALRVFMAITNAPADE